MKAFLILLVFGLLACSAYGGRLEVRTNRYHRALQKGNAPAFETLPLKDSASSSTTMDRTRLARSLFNRDYNKKINPTGSTVKFGMALIYFDPGEKRHTLESIVWLRYMWRDERLQWAKEDYGNLEVLRYDSQDVWLPDITLYNSADPVNMAHCWDSKVFISYTGDVLWVPPCKLITSCKLTLDKTPEEEQNCLYRFGSWTYDGNTVGLELYNNATKIDLEHWSNDEFKIVANSAKKSDKFYSCCEEPYPDITFNMTFRRVPGAGAES